MDDATTFNSPAKGFNYLSFYLKTSQQIEEFWETNDDFDVAHFPNEDESDNGSEILDILSEFHAWQKSVEQAVVSLTKKKKSLQNELQKIENIQQLQARANIITTYMFMFTGGVRSVVVQDWEQGGAEVEITLNEKFDSASEEASAIYEQARRMKRGSQAVRPLLEATEIAMVSLFALQRDLNDALSVDDNQVDETKFREIQNKLMLSTKTSLFVPPTVHESKTQSTTKRPEKRHPRQRKPNIGDPASNVRKIVSEAGNIILVGRNRRGNEYISLSLAKGQDIWMHARGTPGAHVLIKISRFAKVSDSCIQLGANLAAFYSDARNERKVVISAAEPKHVLKPRGAPLGAVKLREELFVRTGFPEDVPDNLKDARDASGLATDYRATDKAKLRKRNLEWSKQLKATKKSRKE
jgi:predicted ribosome quality control (RQC) complex YloA/Tae2 family protein